MIRKIVGHDAYGYPEYQDVPARVLVAVQNAQAAIKMREVFPGVCICAPDFTFYDRDFDVLVMSFNPDTDAEQRWFHLTLMPALAKEHEIVWTLH